MRRLLTLIPLAALLLSPATRREHVPDPSPRIAARAIPLDRDDPGRRTIGRLRFLAGWSLSSREPDMGGISSMSVAGGRVTALSDRGIVIAFDLPVAGIAANARLFALPQGPGDRAFKGGRDSESMTRDPASGQMWVGFEGANAIWRYAAGLVRGQGGAVPPQMADWSANSGAEAIVRLADGRFLVFSEGRRGPDGGREAWLFASDPGRPGARAVRFGLRLPSGYRPTEAALLPDGRVLVLERRAPLVHPLAVRLIRIDPARIRPGRAVPTETIAAWGAPLAVDNMEALAITQEAGRTIVWIASDDNFLFFQRSLLLKFVLEG